MSNLLVPMGARTQFETGSVVSSGTVSVPASSFAFASSKAAMACGGTSPSRPLNGATAEPPFSIESHSACVLPSKGVAAVLWVYQSSTTPRISASQSASGAERMRGERALSPLDRLARDLLHRAPEPSDVVLTVDKRVHDAAIAALGDASGAVVALDPRT